MDDIPPILESPREILEKFLIELDYKSLQSACRAHRKFSEICRDDRFWRLKLEHDYNITIKNKATWKETWIDKIKPKLQLTWEYVVYDEGDDTTYLSYRDYTYEEINSIKEYISEVMNDPVNLDYGEYFERYFFLDDIVINDNEITFIFDFPIGVPLADRWIIPHDFAISFMDMITSIPICDESRGECEILEFVSGPGMDIRRGTEAEPLPVLVHEKYKFLSWTGN